MYVTSPTSNVISIVDLTTNKLVTSLPVPGNPFTVAFNPEGTRRYVTNSGAGTISVVDNSNNAIVKEIPVGKSPVRGGQHSPRPVRVRDLGSGTARCQWSTPRRWR